MDLFTRCPQCDTVFRVTTRHLQASGGQVRCGRCQTVFDAFASLTAKPPAAEKETPASSEEASVASPVAQTEPVAAQEAAPAKEPGAKPDRDTGLAEKEQKPAPGTRPVPVAQATEASPMAIADRLAHDPATNLFEWEFKAAPRNPRVALWLSLSVVMALLAFAQAAYLFRTSVMVSVPQLRPVYQLACRWLSCEIGLPRLTEQLHIDASDLQFIDAEKRNHVLLTALVRNRARVAIEYPALELTLTNAQEKVVARRVFLPEDYLSQPELVANGLGGRGEFSVRLFLDTGSLRAAGYRIYLFYPT